MDQSAGRLVQARQSAITCLSALRCTDLRYEMNDFCARYFSSASAIS